LSKVVAIINPAARDSIEEDSRLASVQEIMSPSAPFCSETSAPENLIKAILVDTIESFMEI
jgi:hypothetical protein